MLAIRMQRTGRKGHAMFRMVVQDARRTPTSGKVVAQLGSYDPHAKTLTIDKEKAGFYLEHGAQPSDRVTVLLKNEGVKLPKWVKDPTKKDSAVRNPDKRRSTRPEEPAAEPAETTAEETSGDAETASESAADESPADAATANADDAADSAEESAEEPAAAEPQGASDEAETDAQQPAEPAAEANADNSSDASDENAEDAAKAEKASE